LGPDTIKAGSGAQDNETGVIPDKPEDTEYIPAFMRKFDDADILRDNEDDLVNESTEAIKSIPRIFIATKLIYAGEISELKFHSKNPENREDRPGYLINYSGGYTSWSPKEEFENAYRQVFFDIPLPVASGIILYPYIGSKIVAALEMTNKQFYRNGGKILEEVEGYQVIYSIEANKPYESWCPKKQFEETHRELTNNERILLSTF
jgi:hypothetical protein